jgi:hypothetical protein
MGKWRYHCIGFDRQLSRFVSGTQGTWPPYLDLLTRGTVTSRSGISSEKWVTVSREKKANKADSWPMHQATPLLQPVSLVNVVKTNEAEFLFLVQTKSVIMQERNPATWI